MEDTRIVALYLERPELAIQETDNKYHMFLHADEGGELSFEVRQQENLKKV